MKRLAVLLAALAAVLVAVQPALANGPHPPRAARHHAPLRITIPKPKHSVGSHYRIPV